MLVQTGVFCVELNRIDFQIGQYDVRKHSAIGITQVILDTDTAAWVERESEGDDTEAEEDPQVVLSAVDPSLVLTSDIGKRRWRRRDRI